MVIVRRLLWLAFVVAVLVIGWRFAAANADEIHLDYLFGRFENVKVWVLVVSIFGLGALAGVAVCLIELARLGLLSRRYRKALGRLEAELHGLRSLPLGPEGSNASPVSRESADIAAAGRPGRST
jgi:uncharacterized membrane protein YciS (DUF1049 family)